MRILRSMPRIVRPLTTRTVEKLTAERTAQATPRQSSPVCGVRNASARPAKAASIAKSRSRVKDSVPDNQPATAISSG